MSTADESADRVTNPSRQANWSNPASTDRDADAAESLHRPDHLPTPEEVVAEIREACPERVWAPMSTTHRRKLRTEALAEAETVEREIETGDGETAAVEDTVSRSALPWLAVVEAFLRDYEGYRDRYLRMGKGRPDTPEREEFLVPMNNSYAPEYQQKQYARLKALSRQLVGESADDSPTGEEFGGEFDEPVTVLFSLTASSTTDGGEYRPPTDHDREIRDAWGGSDGVRRTLRYVLQDKLGLESSEYAWWWQSEPHPGDGAAAGYSHSHPVVILDAAGAAVEELDAETFRPVVAKHLAECEAAGADAHRLDDAVTVRRGDELEDVASYVADYVAVDPDADLFERSPEYILWAASQWSTTTQKYSKSRTATAAIDADRCHQRYADADADQDADHGERVVRSDRRGVEYECAECGSEFGVDQSGTLVSHRLAADDADGAAGGAEVRTDGGSGDGEGLVHEDADAPLTALWPSADGAARVGAPTRERECGHADGAAECPLCCPEGETVDAGTPIPETATAPPGEEIRESVERAPEWEAEAVVQKATGEESVLGSPGGVDYAEVVVEGADAIPPGKLVDADLLRRPEPWRRERRCASCGAEVVHTASAPVIDCEGCGEEKEPPSPLPFTEREVRSGEVPPPELIERQLAEIHRGEPVTAKRWSSDWHRERYGADAADADHADAADADHADAADADHADADDVEEFDRAAVRRYAENSPGASVMQIMTATGAPPSAREFVEEIVG